MTYHSNSKKLIMYNRILEVLTSSTFEGAMDEHDLYSFTTKEIKAVEQCCNHCAFRQATINLLTSIKYYMEDMIIPREHWKTP